MAVQLKKKKDEEERKTMQNGDCNIPEAHIFAWDLTS